MKPIVKEVSISVVVPIENNRVELLLKSLSEYNKLNDLSDIEFVFVTRTIDEEDLHIVLSNFKNFEYKIIRYDISKSVWWRSKYFNPAMALNLGVKNSSAEYVIITSPEVMPLSPVISQFKNVLGQNCVAKVFDECGAGKSVEGSKWSVLVDSSFRCDTPAMYFLTLFNKCDILKINGWDERFLGGYAWEDSDFGERWNRMGIKFIVRDDIVGLHQFHERHSQDSIGWKMNKKLFDDNRISGLIKTPYGIVKEY